ncbi:hypothetical protein FQA47_025098 [Oryzias melastigma]|uniref:Uncharacterized protein n=1 Tax=Oryzias melastigma TaxID=30732 RepID=A0A834BK29_ORYME|nr:hypothetical protein FQA47_025098 [Oryzias melastigma]
MASSSSAVSGAGHDYTQKANAEQDTVIPDEEESPLLSISTEGTPCKEKLQKKAQLATPRGERRSSGCDNDIVDVLSNLINTGFDATEKLIHDNSLKIEGIAWED